MNLQKLSVLILLLLFTACQTSINTWQSNQLEIGINQDGYLDRFKALETGVNYSSKELSPLLQLRIDSIWHLPSKFEATTEEDLYQLSFENTATKAFVRIKPKESHIVLTLERLEGPDPVELAVWGPYANTIYETIGEIVGVVRNNDFALGIQSLNIRTLGGYPTNENDQEPAYDIFESNSIVDVADSVKVLYRGQTARKTKNGSVLQAYVRDRSQTRIIPNWNHEYYVAPAFPDSGIQGSSIALFGVIPSEALATIGRIEVEEGLAHPIIDGEWGKTSRLATSSYLIMNFGVDNLDKAMQLTKEAGLKYLYHGGPFVTWGHFDLNPKEFPNNWESMAQCVRRARVEGLRLGVHTLSNFITTNDPYVSPVPDPRLAKVGSSTIIGTVLARDTEITLKDPRFFNQMKNNTLHAVVIDNEIIRYREVSSSAPWKLMDCERGAFGTRAEDHESGSIISKLMDHGYATFLTDANLSQEVALRIAELFNQTGLLQISFDGLEGNWSTGMGQYGRQLFTQTWYDALDPDLQGKVITDASNPGHFFWHHYTRMNWGEPWYAGFRESQTQYRLLNQAFYQRNLMPAMLGWFRMTNTISLEDIEWLLARAAGFDAGFALATSPAEVESHGSGKLMLHTIKVWEEARLSGAIPEEIKKDLQDINQEFHLEANGPNAWNLFATSMVKAEYSYMEKQPGEPHELKLDFVNENPEQPLSFLLSAPKESGLREIQIEIDNFRKILLPVDLPAGHYIRYTGGSYLKVYDPTWHQIDSGRVIQEHLTLSQGTHHLKFSGVFTEPQGSVKLEFKTLALPLELHKN